MSKETQHQLSKPLLSLIERLSALNGFLELLENQLENFKSLFVQAFEEQGIEMSGATAGYAILIRDLTVPIEQKYPTYLPGGVFIKKGDQYLEASNEIVEKWAAWSVAQSYETFEIFLRDTAAYFFFNWPPEKPLGTLNQVPIEHNDIEAWKKLFRSRQWNTSSMLVLLRLSAHNLDKWEKENNIGVDLQKWHSLLATAQHAVVHSNMIVLRKQFKVSPDEIISLLPKVFPGVWEDDEYTIKFDKDIAKNVIELTGDYAYLVFKCLGKEKGIDCDILQFSSRENPA